MCNAEKVIPVEHGIWMIHNEFRQIQVACFFFFLPPFFCVFKNLPTPFLVGGFNPFEKYSSKWESSPGSDENKTYLSCHHLVYLFCGGKNKHHPLLATPVYLPPVAPVTRHRALRHLARVKCPKPW